MAPLRVFVGPAQLLDLTFQLGDPLVFPGAASGRWVTRRLLACTGGVAGLGHVGGRSAPAFLIATSLPIGGFAMLALATSLWVLLLGPLLCGLGMGLIMAAVPARIGEAVPGPARGRAMAYMSSLLLLGQFISPLLLGPLAGPFGTRAVFLTAAAISALATAAIAAAFHPDRALAT